MYALMWRQNVYYRIRRGGIQFDTRNKIYFTKPLAAIRIWRIHWRLMYISLAPNSRVVEWFGKQKPIEENRNHSFKLVLTVFSMWLFSRTSFKLPILITNSFFSFSVSFSVCEHCLRLLVCVCLLWMHSNGILLRSTNRLQSWLATIFSIVLLVVVEIPTVSGRYIKYDLQK